MHLGWPRHEPLSSRLGGFLGHFAGTEDTRGDESGSSSTWEGRCDDSTCVRVDPDGSVVLAWDVGFASICVVFQSVEFATAFALVKPVINGSLFAVRRLEGSVFSFSHLSLVHPSHRQPLKILVLYFMIHTTYCPSQFRFPYACSRSDRFHSPGLI